MSKEQMYMSLDDLIEMARNETRANKAKQQKMATKPLTRAAKKQMDMSLDDLIARNATRANKAKRQRTPVVLSNTEVESLRSELSDLEEREAHLKARLEHIDEILRSARLSGYLQLRTRWAALPGEPAPLDDTEFDDWRPHFVVLQGQCIFLYFNSTDISPQDSTLLSDVVEVGRLPCFSQEDEEIHYCFYIVTRSGLRYECSSASKLQVDAWVTTLLDDCKLGSDTTTLDHSHKT